MGLSLKRLESLALRELSILLRNDAKHKHLSSVTVTEVRITNDLSYMITENKAWDENLTFCVKGVFEFSKKIATRYY